MSALTETREREETASRRSAMDTAAGRATLSPSVEIVPLVGEHDLSEYESLRIALATAAIHAANVIVDLSCCSFIDSTLIRLLVDAAQSVETRAEGSFSVALPAEPNAVTRIAELVHLSQRVATFPSVAAALEALQEPFPLGTETAAGRSP